MSLTKPTELPPQWATGGADYEEPSPSKKLLGWVKELPPYKWFNWWQRGVSEWLEYLREGHVKKFDSLQDAVEYMEEGEVAVVDEYDPTVAPLAYTPFGATGTVAGAAPVACDSKYFFYAYDTNLYCYTRSGIQVWTQTVTSVGALHSDGEWLYVADGNVLYRRNRDTGALDVFWTDPNHGATINGVYSDSDFVFIAGNYDGFANNARAYDTATGTQQWAGDPEGGTNNASSIVSDGQDVWIVYGDITVNNAHRISRSTGASQAIYSHQGWLNKVVVGEDGVYIAGNSAPGNIGFVKLTKNTMAKIWDGQVHDTVAGLTGLAYDGRYLYISGGDGSNPPSGEVGATLRAVDPCSGKFCFSVDTDAGAYQVCADINAVFFSYLAINPSVAFARAVRSRTVKRVSETDRYRAPMHHLVVPIER